MRLLSAAFFTIAIMANVSLLSASQVTGSLTGTVNLNQGADPFNVFGCPAQDCGGLAVNVSWSFDPGQFGPLQTGPGFSQGKGINMGTFSETINGVTKTIDSSAYFLSYAATAPALSNDLYEIAAASAAEPIAGGSEGDYTLVGVEPGGTFLHGLGPIQNLNESASIQSFGALEITHFQNSGNTTETIQFSVDNVSLNSSTPEPGTWALMIVTSLFWRRRVRKVADGGAGTQMSRTSLTAFLPDGAFGACRRIRHALNSRVVFLALLLSALFLSGAAKQMAAAQIQFDNVDGHYLAQVYAAVQRGGVSTRYNGYVNNYGILPIGNTNFGSAVPSGLFPTTFAFMDPLTGNLGVAGSSPLGLADDYADVAYAQFAIALQFNQAGTVSFSMHVPGSVGAFAVNPPSDYAYASMQTSVAIVDNSPFHSTGASSAGTKLCIDRFLGVYGRQCSTPLTVNQNFVATLDVVPGHVYTLSATEWGTESSYGIFDGIDPVSLSVQLDPGMSIVPVDGMTLPGFLGGPGSSSVPEPATWALTGCAAVILVGRRLLQLRRLGASPATQSYVGPGGGV